MEKLKSTFLEKQKKYELLCKISKFCVILTGLSFIAFLFTCFIRKSFNIFNIVYLPFIVLQITLNLAIFCLYFEASNTLKEIKILQRKINDNN